MESRSVEAQHPPASPRSGTSWTTPSPTSHCRTTPALITHCAPTPTRFRLRVRVRRGYAHTARDDRAPGERNPQIHLQRETSLRGNRCRRSQVHRRGSERDTGPRLDRVRPAGVTGAQWVRRRLEYIRSAPGDGPRCVRRRSLNRRVQVFVGVENLFDNEYDVGRTPILTTDCHGRRVSACRSLFRNSAETSLTQGVWRSPSGSTRTRRCTLHDRAVNLSGSSRSTEGRRPQSNGAATMANRSVPSTTGTGIQSPTTANEIEDIRPVQTLVGGRVVYDAASATSFLALEGGNSDSWDHHHARRCRGRWSGSICRPGPTRPGALERQEIHSDERFTIAQPWRFAVIKSSVSGRVRRFDRLRGPARGHRSARPVGHSRAHRQPHAPAAVRHTWRYEVRWTGLTPREGSARHASRPHAGVKPGE